MTPPREAGAPAHRRSPSSRLPRWAGVVFPAGVAASIAFVLVDRVNQTLVPSVVQAASVAGLGVILGFTTRWSARGRSATVQWWIAMGAITVGLLVAGMASGGSTGIATPVIGQAGVRVGELVELAVAGLCAWLAISFRRPRPARPSLRQRWQAARDGIQMRWAHISPIQVWQRRHPGVQATPPRAEVSTSRLTSAGIASRSRTSLRSRASTSPAKPQARAKVPKRGSLKATRPSIRAARRAKARAIRFTGAEESRCPYCLDLVRPNDPRGSRICPVCHTRHHADCWAVTGVCQMPHLFAPEPDRHQGVAR